MNLIKKHLEHSALQISMLCSHLFLQHFVKKIWNRGKWNLDIPSDLVKFIQQAWSKTSNRLHLL